MGILYIIKGEVIFIISVYHQAKLISPSPNLSDLI